MVNYFIFETFVRSEYDEMTFYFDYAIDNSLSSSEFETIKIIRAIEDTANNYDNEEINCKINSLTHSIESYFDNISPNIIFYQLSRVQKMLEKACSELYGDKVFIRRSSIGTDELKIPIYYNKLAEEMER